MYVSVLAEERVLTIPVIVPLACGLLVVLAGPRAGRAIGTSPPEIAGIEEASGVVRQGDRLIIVGDHYPGTYYSCPIGTVSSGRIPLGPRLLTRHRIAAGIHGIDLEAVDVLADGRIVILSERLGVLFDANTVVATYGQSVAEFGGRGLEGLAVRDLGGGRSRVAILWEGGYPERGRLPSPVREAVRDRALLPQLVVHDLEAGQTGLDLRNSDASPAVELRVPRPPGSEPRAQRFRTPDLVWHRWEVNGEATWGFLVLLSSEYGERPGPEERDAECPRAEDGRPRKYCYKLLQRFDREGMPYGESFDLEAALPEELHTVNWEGMGWFEPGESLVLVYDEKVYRRRVDPQVAFVIPLPEGW